MARPLRIEYPGAWYHVMNRGGRRRLVFNTGKREKGISPIIDLNLKAHPRLQPCESRAKYWTYPYFPTSHPGICKLNKTMHVQVVNNVNVN